MLGWLFFYPAFWAAIVVLMRRRIREFHASLWLDGIVAALAMAACVAALVLPPILAMSVEGDPAPWPSTWPIRPETCCCSRCCSARWRSPAGDRIARSRCSGSLWS